MELINQQNNHSNLITVTNRQPKLLILKRKIRDTVHHLHNTDQIFTNLFALFLCGAIFLLLQLHWILPNLGKAQGFLYGVLVFLSVVQILKSSKKSLLLPMICVLLSGAYLTLQHFGFINFQLFITLSKYVMLLGIVGCLISILHID